MKLKEYFSANVEFSEKEDLLCEVSALIIAEGLDDGEYDTLLAAWELGLMESGYEPSKSSRDELVAKGLLCQTAYKKSNYTFSVTYPLGYQVIKALKVINRQATS